MEGQSQVWVLYYGSDSNCDSMEGAYSTQLKAINAAKEIERSKCDYPHCISCCPNCDSASNCCVKESPNNCCKETFGDLESRSICCCNIPTVGPYGIIPLAFE